MAVNLRAADLMTPHVIVAYPTMSIVEAAKLMNKFRIGGLPIINKQGKLIGIVTERCIMKHVIAKNKKPSRTKIKDIMVKGKLVTSEPGESVDSIVKKMGKHDIARMPVVDDGKIVGIITNKDVIESAPALIDMVLEQASIKGSFEGDRSLSFGKCERCGNASDLFYKEESFMCDSCSGTDKLRQQKRFIGRFFNR